jgi:hypothetical protein
VAITACVGRPCDGRGRVVMALLRMARIGVVLKIDNATSGINSRLERLDLAHCD